MNITPVRLLTVALLCTLVTEPARAASVAYTQILKDRERVLSQLLNEQESRRASGHADEEAIFIARVSLYSFRRDSAPIKTEKVKHQLMVVAAHEERLVTIKRKAEMGVGANVEVLRATDGLLQAKQILEELRLIENTG